MYMQCDLCTFICRPLAALFLKHYKTHSSTSEKYAKLAKYAGMSIRRLEEQTRLSQVKQNLLDKFRCAKCSKSFTQRKSYHRHLKIHEKKVYHCQKCNCAFKSTVAFRSHQQRHRKKKTSLFCDLCGKHFRSKDGYKYHRQNKCIQYTCHVCAKTLKGKPALVEHLKTEHDMDNASDLEHAGLKSSSSQTSMCFVCGKIIKNINLQRHMMVHNEEKPFVCDLCGKRFKFKNAIRDHMMVKLGMKDYVCEICGRKFVKRSYLNKHLRFHNMSKEEQKRYRCDVCNKKFSELRLLVAHRRVSHDGEKPFSCDLCGKAYSSKISLRNHLLREVICVLCDEIFISNELLKQHVISGHNVKKYREEVNKRIEVQSSFVYPCDICGRRFTSEERYRQHILVEVKCEFCGVQCVHNEELKAHIEIHHNLQEYRKIMSLRWRKRIRLGNADSAEYACNLCGKKLFYKRTLLLHMRMHSGLKPYKCEYCNKAYTSKHSLNVHLISEMNLRKYVCSYCGKRYNFNSDLIVHVKQRHETRQFSCHVCGKEFGLLKYLKDHSTIHSREKPFNCEKCNLGFRLKKFLLRHNRKYHVEGVVEIVTADEV